MSLLIDIGYSAKRLWRFRALTAFLTITMTLALIAGGTAMSVTAAISFREIFAVEPDRLVAIEVFEPNTGRPSYIYAPTFEAFRTAARSFSGSALYVSSFLLRGERNGAGFDLITEAVTGDFFGLMGVPVVIGRGLEAQDDQPRSNQRAVVISHDVWSRRFAADPDILGKEMSLEAATVTVVGVAAPQFQGASGDTTVDSWVSIATARALTANSAGIDRAPQIVARLRSGSSLENARAEVIALWPTVLGSSLSSLPIQTADSVRSQQISLTSASGGFSLLRRQYAAPAATLFALSVLFYLLAIANVTGLLVAKSLQEEHQTHLRLALGATKWNLLADSCIAGLVIAAPCILIALPVTWQLSSYLSESLSANRSFPVSPPLTPDPSVAATVGLAAAFGCVAAFAVPTMLSSLKPMALLGERTASRPVGFPARALVAVQVAMSLSLLIGSGLLMRTMQSLEANLAHVRGKEVLFGRLPRVPGDRAPLGAGYLTQLVIALSEISGVRSVALSSTFPGYLASRTPPPMEEYFEPSRPSEGVSAITDYVSPGFFETFDITMLHGREFSWADADNAPAVAVLNERAATLLRLESNAVGAHITARTSGVNLRVIGVIGTTPLENIRLPDAPVIFRAMAQNSARAQAPITHVRVESTSLPGLREAIGRGVARLDHHYVRTLFAFDDWLDSSLMQERLLYQATAALTVVALVLAAGGLYAAMAYSVHNRSREMAVRLALGATGASLVGQILREGLWVILTGIGLGLPVILWAAQFAQAQLFGVQAFSPDVIVWSVVAFLLTGGAALLLPAMKAARTDVAPQLRS